MSDVEIFDFLRSLRHIYRAIPKVETVKDTKIYFLNRPTKKAFVSASGFENQQVLVVIVLIA